MQRFMEKNQRYTTVPLLNAQADILAQQREWSSAEGTGDVQLGLFYLKVLDMQACWKRVMWRSCLGS